MKKKLLYWIPTGLLLFGMVGSGVYYFVDTPAAAQAFADLGYPSYTLYFNAIAKFLGGIALVTPVSSIFKEWAYAGYLFILLLATQAIYVMMPEGLALMFVFFALWGLSYWQYKVQKR